MKPAFASLLFGSRVPSDSEALQAATGKGNEILLEGEDAERVGELVILELASGPVGANIMFFVLLIKARRYCVICKSRVIEIPENGLVIRPLHGQGMMRTSPRLRLFRMASSANCFADVSGRCCLGIARSPRMSCIPAPQEYTYRNGRDHTNEQENSIRWTLRAFLFVHRHVASLLPPRSPISLLRLRNLKYSILAR